MDKKMKDIICKVMGISQASYYRWKQERPVINLLEKYCTEEDLEEFLVSGRISKFESTFADDEEMDEFFLKNALSKIEMYGTRENTPFFGSIKQALKIDEIPSCLPVKTFLTVLTTKTVHDLKSFEVVLDTEKVKFENWKTIIRDFITNKLSQKELKALVKNKIYVKEYLSSLPHLAHG